MIDWVGASRMASCVLARPCHRPSVPRLRFLVLESTLLCIAVTIAIAVVPALHFAYRDTPLHVALETTATLVGLVVAFLLFGRFRRARRIDELVLACGLALLASSNLVFAALPSVLALELDKVEVWGTLIATAAAAIVICAAAFCSRRPLPVSSRWPPVAVGVSFGFVLVLVLVLVSTFHDMMPMGVRGSIPAGAERPSLVAHPALLATQLLLAATYAVAAFGFGRKNARTGDELNGWLALACVLASAARVNYFLYPSLYSTWVYSGDMFRLGFYLVLLIGAAREIASYWTSALAAAHLEERRRIARDLHDGLAQEIAFIGRNAALLRDAGAQAAAVDAVERIVAAAERARVESRRVVAALNTHVQEPLERSLTQAAHEAAARYGASIDLRLAGGIVLAPAEREAVVRIAGEAVTNAARHSGARDVRLDLDRLDGAVRLRVVDHGCGFDSTTHDAQGFGLISMRERAEALGGRFQIRSSKGIGTRVEVVL
jgi:signal transduction histidine kinase